MLPGRLVKPTSPPSSPPPPRDIRGQSQIYKLLMRINISGYSCSALCLECRRLERNSLSMSHINHLLLLWLWYVILVGFYFSSQPSIQYIPHTLLLMSILKTFISFMKSSQQKQSFKIRCINDYRTFETRCMTVYYIMKWMLATCNCI